ncbi:MAG: hypothetical protein AB7V13_12665 [Pseudorhodoplanes sp.]
MHVATCMFGAGGIRCSPIPFRSRISKTTRSGSTGCRSWKKKKTPKSVLEWAAAAESDMIELGFDPKSREGWRGYAIVRYHDYRLITGIEKSDGIVEIDAATHANNIKHADMLRSAVIALRLID